MGWQIGFDNHWDRDIGYGVPAICDQPKCKREIDRGLSYVCGSEAYGGDFGCGLFFCSEHLIYSPSEKEVCIRCFNEEDPFEPKPDIDEWNKWKLTDKSWAKWREDNPQKVKLLNNQYAKSKEKRS